jgi:NAD(P)-dependent dehydrogenase (short-subunit alcohol dehydrogenase family)
VNSIARAIGIAKGHEPGRWSSARRPSRNERTPPTQRRLTSIIQRFASPDEVAALIVYTASTQASATTGSALRVDGGVVKSAF